MLMLLMRFFVFSLCFYNFLVYIFIIFSSTSHGNQHFSSKYVSYTILTEDALEYVID